MSRGGGISSFDSSSIP
eukprot:gene27285-biopygen17798